MLWASRTPVYLKLSSHKPALTTRIVLGAVDGVLVPAANGSKREVVPAVNDTQILEEEG